MSFFKQLEERLKVCECPICVGLDPHINELSEPTAKDAKRFCLNIIDKTKHCALCYKPNSAFFECLDGGIEVLKEVLSQFY